MQLSVNLGLKKLNHGKNKFDGQIEFFLKNHCSNPQ
jgi:hypothetical protein